MCFYTVSQGLDQIELPDSIVKAIDSVFAEFNNIRSPGSAVGIVKDGNFVFARGYGMASLEHDLIITPHSAFYAASVSKQFTAFAVALLANKGKLTLEDDIRTWIPEVPDFGSSIKIRHLLHHTSGLRDYFGLLNLRGWPMDGPVTESEFLNLVRNQRNLNFSPGSQYLYSNTGYVLLSILVKRVSGQSLRDFAQSEIFEPLGMSQTKFRDDHTMLIKNRSLAYTPDSESETGYSLSMPGFDVIGDGGLYTTVNDLARWAKNFDSQKVGGARVADMMLKRGILTSGDTTSYAMGLSHFSHRGLPMVGHGGSYAGYRANFVRFPNHGFSIFILSNRSNAELTRRTMEIAEILLGEYMEQIEMPSNAGIQNNEKEGIKLERTLLEQYSDTYWRVEDVGALLHLSLNNDRLVLNDVSSSRTTPLIPISDSIFRLEDGRAKIIFKSGVDEVAKKAVWEGDGGWKTSLRLINKWNPDKQTIRKFEGLYFSPEVETFYEIVLEENQLITRHHRREDLPLTPAEKDGFGSAYPLMKVQFQRDRNGKITGFLVSAGRVQDILFEKQE
ncbi:beta-lactamase family protein [Psychroflexus sp. CAK1W]|uniref:serine hydrolase domain-containing protein n=1 Tax=Psychroflexus curvus TaxID=2873595 RepID=UPI001CCBB460|nr:serine hydrolase domain-containing protein [Psychroflexus curvus]MBZ9628117.1 beta-lactamase family protein [Psychroflexus curvus]